MTHALANRSRYIPWLFVAGFAVVIAVNATMICFAVGSFSGLYTPVPRDRGLHYNAIIAEQKARDALGWRVDAVWRAESGRLEVAVFDAGGQPLAGARIAAELIRPVEKRPPLAVVLAAIDLGRFAASVDLPERGNWDLDIVVEQGGDRYALTRRMFLK
jgi:nitrogen fixation protein FixH